MPVRRSILFPHVSGPFWISCHSSTNNGLWSSTTTLPSTMTVWTLRPSALYTRLFTGLKNRAPLGSLGVEQHQVRLFARFYGADFRIETQSFGALNRCHFQGGLRRHHAGGLPGVFK